MHFVGFIPALLLTLGEIDNCLPFDSFVCLRDGAFVGGEETPLLTLVLF